MEPVLCCCRGATVQTILSHAILPDFIEVQNSLTRQITVVYCDFKMRKIQRNFEIPWKGI